jgi:polyphosphate kinase 2 (PPK2 family)
MTPMIYLKHYSLKTAPIDDHDSLRHEEVRGTNNGPFDRSWDNPAMVEPVMAFCTQAQYKLFIDNVISYERSFIEDKSTLLIKLYFSVSKEEQTRRFERRRLDSLRQWKLSEVDLQAQGQSDQFT